MNNRQRLLEKIQSNPAYWRRKFAGADMNMLHRRMGKSLSLMHAHLKCYSRKFRGEINNG